MNDSRWLKLLAAGVTALAVGACGGGGGDDEDGDEGELREPLPGNVQAYLMSRRAAGDFYLQRVRNSSDGQESIAEDPQTILGLPQNAEVIGIDTRPQDGVLYLVTRRGAASNSLGAIYSLSTPLPNTGNIAATLVAELTPAAADTDPFTGFSSAANYGVDFNPVANALRIVGTNGDNLRIPFATLASPLSVVTDGDVNQNGSAVTNIVAAAYTNNVGGATSTQLFDIGSGPNPRLFLQNPPNDGTLITPVNLTGIGFTPSVNLAFDIVTTGASNIAFVVFESESGSDELLLGTVNLGNGVVTPLVATDDSPDSERIVGLAIGTVP